MHNSNAQQEQNYEDQQEREAAIGHAKMLFNYIKENELDYHCLCDDLTDFIQELLNKE